MSRTSCKKKDDLLKSRRTRFAFTLSPCVTPQYAEIHRRVRNDKNEAFGDGLRLGDTSGPAQRKSPALRLVPELASADMVCSICRDINVRYQRDLPLTLMSNADTCAVWSPLFVSEM